MQYGMNLFLWTDTPQDERYLPLYERLKAMGFDGVELPIFSGTPEDYAVLGRRLGDMGLACTAITVRTAQDDPISADPAVRRAAIEQTNHAIDCAAAAGSPLLGGPLYAALGEFSGAGPTPEEWAHAVEVIRENANHAARAGITLQLEVLKRFEIYLLNCASDTARFVRAINLPNVGVHYDTFHANLEEKDVRQAIVATGPAIGHVHISENDRSTPGKGQVRWEETFDALAEIDYDGWLTIEAFGMAIPSLAAATKIWRPLFGDEEELAHDGLAFMRQEWERRRN